MKNGSTMGYVVTAVMILGHSSAAHAAYNLPDSPSCNEIANVISQALSECGHPHSIPLLLSQGQCHVTRLTTPLDFPEQLYRELMPVNLNIIGHIETNFREMISQEMYNIQAAEGLDKVERISAEMLGDLRFTVDGVIDTNGNVDVVLDGFSLEAVGKMRQSVAKIYIKMKFNNIRIQGTYNIYTGQLLAVPAMSGMQPEISHEVSVPFVFKVLQKLTPKILLKLSGELENLANKIVRAVGGKITEDIPTVVQHQAAINPAVLLPVKNLQNGQPGAAIRYQLIGNKNSVVLNYGGQSLRSQMMPVCPGTPPKY